MYYIIEDIPNNVKDLKTILNASYESNPKAREDLEDKGYIFDDELSNDKQNLCKEFLKKFREIQWFSVKNNLELHIKDF